MIKFVLILTSVISLNFTTAFTEVESEKKSVELNFSQAAIAVESGQPVYPSNTKIWITSNNKDLKKIELLINESEITIENQHKIDLSNVAKINSGTYTLIVKAEQETTFGFTIQ
ncbi:MAG: hypothetical protein AB8B73_01725 [Ekhidna sp.]